MIFASGENSEIVERSTDYGISFERLADCPIRLGKTDLTIVDNDTVFLGPGTLWESGNDRGKNGEFYKFTLSSNTWTRMADFPVGYYEPTCTMWERAPDYEKEIYCFGAGSQELYIYNVARDEWRGSGSVATDRGVRGGASIFTYEGELYEMGGYQSQKKLYR